MSTPTLLLQGQVEENNFRLNLCFHTITSEQITLSTDITDHLVEDHSMVQDHITIKPTVYTLRGLISEKFFEHPDTTYIEIPPEPLSVRLSPLAIIAPRMSSYVHSAINAYEAVKYRVEQIVSVYQNLKSLRGLLRRHPISSMFSNIQIVDQSHKKWAKDRLQKQIIEVLNDYRINRMSVSIDTGWGMGLEDNFYITDISVNQGDSYQQSELSVTVKQLRFTSTKLVDLTADKAGRLSQQYQDWQNTVNGSKDGELKSTPYKIKEKVNANNNGNN